MEGFADWLVDKKLYDVGPVADPGVGGWR
jgi:hypothetical protein